MSIAPAKESRAARAIMEGLRRIRAYFPNVSLGSSVVDKEIPIVVKSALLELAEFQEVFAWDVVQVFDRKGLGIWGGTVIAERAH